MFCVEEQEVFEMMLLVAVGFLYMLNIILLSSYEIVISTKLISYSETSEMHCKIQVVKYIINSYFCYFLYLLQFAGEL